MERSVVLRVAATGIATAVLFGCPIIAIAQPRAGAIQLPTFRFFATSTTVEVPDSGGASLGGVTSSASGRSERGVPGLGGRPFDNVATGRATGAGSTSVTATVHDLDAMDRQLLAAGGDVAHRANPTANEIARQRLPVMLRYRASSDPIGERTDVASRLMVDAAGGASIAEIRRQQSAEDAAANDEAAKLLDQGRQIAAAGKSGVARTYYRMAWRRATGDLKNQIAAAAGELNREPAGKDSVATRANW